LVRDFVAKTFLVVLVALVALAPGAAHAAGLGRLTVVSALGHPLNVEIDLVSVATDELATLNARLASADAYRQANLQYTAAVAGLRLSIEKRPNGQPFIRVASHNPINEPFIDLLVELIWSSGRVIREYTALLDPPGMGPVPAAPPAAALPETRPVPQPPVAVAPAIERPAALARAPRAAPAPMGPRAGAKEYGPIERGETLGKIARSVMPDGVTLEQMLVGLYRSNPDAFIRKNLNLVRAGKVLRVPDREEIAAVPRTEAVQEYSTQVADWNAYRQKLADTAGLVPAEGRATVSGRITARVEDKAAAAGPKDVVRLSKGEPPGAAPGAGKPRSTAERVRALEEEVIAREKALNEANERIAQLEKTIKDMQKLVELKSPALAAAQQQAAKPKPEAVAVTKPEPAPAPKPEAVAVAKPEAAPAPKPEAAPEPKPEVAPAEKPEAKVAEAPKPKPKVVQPPPPPPPPPSLLDQILEEPLYLAAGGGVLLLSLGLLVARRRRTHVEAGGMAEPEAPKLRPDVAAAAPAAGALAAEADAAPDASAAMAGVSEEVDPLAEAEVYIAYGRDGQAEEILKEALAKNRNRQDAHLKLLEIYAARKDKNAFGRQAAEFSRLTGGTGDNWLKVAAMGYALDPVNPLYAAGKSAPAAAALSGGPITGTDLDFDLGVAAAGLTTTDIELDAGAARETETEVLAPGALQGMADEARKAKTGSTAPAEPDFVLDLPDSGDQPTRADFALDAPAKGADPNAIDFQLELPKVEEPDADDDPTTVVSRHAGGVDFKLDADDINLDLEGKPGDKAAAGAGKDSHWHDVQTKFDLAKAYQEMGDESGAKEILAEVITEGDAEQKKQAKALLEKLG
jgi:pilus assembly protein FimV